MGIPHAFFPDVEDKVGAAEADRGVGAVVPPLLGPRVGPRDGVGVGHAEDDFGLEEVVDEGAAG